MSRRMRVRVLATYLMEYDLELDGTVDPEQVSRDSLWLHVTEKLAPTREELRSETFVSAEEIPGGQ